MFLPPLFAAEDWLELIAAVEDTAAEAGRKVVLEGYLPPSRSAADHFSVTPDPGVIEVNVHPAHTWAGAGQAHRGTLRGSPPGRAGDGKVHARRPPCRHRRRQPRGDGRRARRRTRPFLRRPDLLKSLLGFWHNHPSLSYLFSGLFIGPTSQHPRIDEARQDSLAELEIAFAQISPWRETPPWMTDRLFRNILADMTGNTHRTEFCIDKLYTPEGGVRPARPGGVPRASRCRRTRGWRRRRCC